MAFEMKTFCFLSMLIVSVCSGAQNTAHNTARCTTSDGQQGKCKVLPKCKQAMAFVQIHGIQSHEAQAFLHFNKCGFEGLNPKVCCSKKRGSVGDRPAVNENNFSPPVDDGWNNNWNEQPATTTRRPQHVNPLSLLPIDCGRDESDRIIGGQNTTLDEFPWMAMLEYRGDGKPQSFLGCGGTLISKRYVLTAAHCIRAVPSYLQLTHVRLGEHDLRENPDCVWNRYGGGTCADPMLSVPIESKIVHEDYNIPQLYRNDIALLRLARDVTFSRYVKPICLPNSAKMSPNYWSAGWGMIENKRNSDIKLKVNLPYVDSAECALKYSRKRIVLGSSQICAGGKAGKDTCKGDSGGPLMQQVPATYGPHRWVINGVLSIGHSPCGLEGWPGVYTKVYDYVKWIVDNLKP